MNQEKGVSLIITFLIMTIMFAVVLGIITVLLVELKVVGNTGDSVSSFYAADSGVEKTFYLERASVAIGSPIGKGFCRICTTCRSITNDCSNCRLTALASRGCRSSSCNNCKVRYSSNFDNRKFDVEATITPGPSNPVFFILSTGYYNNIKRTSFFDSSK